jgi:hypothetical protein
MKLTFLKRRKSMDFNLICEIESLERTVTYCDGRPVGEELPQVATEQEIVSELISQTMH